jgi:hypothetical protein
VRWHLNAICAFLIPFCLEVLYLAEETGVDIGPTDYLLWAFGSPLFWISRHYALCAHFLAHYSYFILFSEVRFLGF